MKEIKEAKLTDKYKKNGSVVINEAMSLKSCWWFKIASFLWLSSVLAFGSQAAIAQNQIVPDNTLAEESSTVTPGVIKGIESDRIEGGAQRGANLFHSFENFNVDEGRGAYFTNPAGIENILSRVTGANPSEILGTLGVLGEANLFLINPNGVIFGPNASLDVGGSFIVTTANGIGLGETGLFSATEPETSNLLAINPSALFFNALAAGEITNRSQAFGRGRETNSVDFPVGLQVPPGETLAMVGGNVVLEGGNLTAAGGRIELGSVVGGEVSLTQSENNWIFEYDETNTFGNIRLQDRAFVDASGSGGGDVQIQGARFEMSGSFLFADTLGSEEGGEVFVRTTEAVTLMDSSLLTAQVFGSGSGGDLTIKTRQLTLRDESQIKATALDEQNGETLTLKALPVDASEPVAAIGYSTVEDLGSISLTQTQVAGTVGDLIIETQQLIVEDGAQISTITGGEGNKGSLTIKATESIAVTGYSADSQIVSGLFALTQGSGAGGNLTVETKQLSVRDGAVIGAGTFSTGDGGFLTVKATDSVEVIGTSVNGQINPSALGTLNPGPGEGGNLTIETKQLSVRDGAVIGAATFGSEDAGDLTVKATDSVEVIGESANGEFLSGLGTRTQGEGKAGDLTIETRQLTVRDGAQIGTATFGSGDAGDLTVKATESINLIGLAQRSSGLFTLAQYAETGAAGNLTIETGELILQDGAAISTATFGSENAGDLTIETRQLILQDGTIGTATFGSGDAGDLTIETGQLILQNGAVISTSSSGEGDAGEISVNVRNQVSLDGSFVLSSVESEAIGNSGKINIKARSLALSNGAALITRMEGQGKAGSINIQAEQLTLSSNAALIGDLDPTGKGRGGDINLDVEGEIRLIGGESVPTGESTRITLGILPGGTGSGGNLNVEADSFVLEDGAIVKSSSQGQGEAGNIQIDANFVDISGSVPSSGLPSGLFTSTANTDRAGDIIINTNVFRIADGAVLSARTLGNGSGGNITVNARDTFEALNGGQLVTTTSGQGKAGSLFVNANQVTLSGSDPNYFERIARFPDPVSPYVANDITETGPSSGLFAQSLGTGNAGNIIINVIDTLNANDGDITTTALQSTGGAIKITAGDIRLRGDSDIRTNVQGAGGGGNITLEADSIIAFDDSDILAFSGEGQGGNITLDTSVFLGENFRQDSSGVDPNLLNNNDRVDINASGATSGVITLPDVSFIQNSLTELPQNPIDTTSLLATSCIVPGDRPQNSFTITGSGGLQSRPEDAFVSPFPLGTIQTIPPESEPNSGAGNEWQEGDAIVEPTGVYRLPNGQLIISRECS